MRNKNLLGCLVRYNRVLLRGSSTPFSIECSFSVNKVRSYNEVRLVALDSVDELSSILGTGLGLGEDPHWEYIGRRFNLYSYPLLRDASVIGELRVVEAGGYIVNVSGVLETSILEYLGKDVVEELLGRGVIGTGNISYPIYLDPINASETVRRAQVPSLIVYAAEGVKELNVESWRLLIRDEQGTLLEMGYEKLIRKSRAIGDEMFHCVTGWSTRLHGMKGVRLSELLEGLASNREYEWLGARNDAGYATIVPFSLALREGVMLTHINNKPLAPENGFPARLFLPSLFGWKSAKWITEIVLLKRYEDGFWEARGYHERGLVASEERFKIRNPALASLRVLLEATPRKLPPR